MVLALMVAVFIRAIVILSYSHVVSCVWTKHSLMLPTRTFLMLMETDHRATGTSQKDKSSGSSRRK